MFERIIDSYYSTFLPICVEILRLLPDSFVLGTAILAGLSMCKSYGILLLTMFELMLTQRLFSMIISGIAPIGAGADVLKDVCQPGFSFSNNMRLSILETIGTPSMFPSPTMFFLSGVISYMIFAMQHFAREIKTLSGDIQVRTQVAFVLSGLFMLATLMFRYSYGCESFGTLLFSTVLGLIVGGAIVYQNAALFGRDGINILNIPMIQTALEQGRPMYVCASSDI
uniref:Uncharacterized protein n=1 Tax=viral metagenome TaxID=1070528 RepID=A0A6C0AMQ3_9ZZZZ